MSDDAFYKTPAVHITEDKTQYIRLLIVWILGFEMQMQPVPGVYSNYKGIGTRPFDQAAIGSDLLGVSRPVVICPTVLSTGIQSGDFGVILPHSDMHMVREAKK